MLRITMNQLSSELKDKLTTLKTWFSQYKGSIVAFSGGIDSTLVLYLARKFQGKENAIGVISKSESLKQKDFNMAEDFCKAFDITLEVIKTDELNDDRYNSNPVNRCFFCKEHLFTDLTKIAEMYPDFKVLSGTNHDDLGDYRPGIDAAKKLNVLSPMVDCKITKQELREIARYFELPNWDKPASPCLSSRMPYGHKVTREKLLQVEMAENILNDYGFNDVRVRHFETYGKIEVLKDDLEKLNIQKDEIVKKITALGFSEIVIDDEGLVSGKLNRAIGK
ncbi:ATP-dependent sacrificial sulfur transferase LarE [Saccharicrinis sp. FJH54]|uniref:ATP-dependent sacrificial sulfur transferase LarE n=1 Tax=Saccharicrinis sp. FJH54 TaxID=3344665 RepID=UPI0035D46E0B